jgi:hypothetical protein
MRARARTPATMKTSVCVASSHCDMDGECVSVGERRKMRERERGTNYQWAARVVLDAWLGGRDEKTRVQIQRAATATTMTTPPSSLKRCARRRLCRGERVARARSMRRRLATPSLRHTNPIVVGGGNKNGFANFSGGTPSILYLYVFVTNAKNECATDRVSRECMRRQPQTRATRDDLQRRELCTPRVPPSLCLPLSRIN